MAGYQWGHRCRSWPDIVPNYRRGTERPVHHFLGFPQNRAEMGLALETLGVDLINVLGTGGARCNPTALRHTFQAADWGIVARSFGQLGGDRLARQLRLLYCVRGEVFQLCFLLGRGGGGGAAG